MNAGEIKGDNFIVSKAPASHGVGAELAQADLMAPAAAVEGVGVPGDGYRPAPGLGRGGVPAGPAPLQLRHRAGAGDDIGAPADLRQ